MNRLLVGTLALSMLSASLAFAQPDPADQRAPTPPTPGAAGTPYPNGQAEPAPTPGANDAQGQANRPYPYGSVGSYQRPTDTGYRDRGDQAAGGDYDRDGGRRAYGYRYHRHHRVCHRHHHRRVCTWR